MLLSPITLFILFIWLQFNPLLGSSRLVITINGWCYKNRIIIIKTTIIFFRWQYFTIIFEYWIIYCTISCSTLYWIWVWLLVSHLFFILLFISFYIFLYDNLIIWVMWRLFYCIFSRNFIIISIGGVKSHSLNDIAFWVTVT